MKTTGIVILVGWLVLGGLSVFSQGTATLYFYRIKDANPPGGNAVKIIVNGQEVGDFYKGTRIKYDMYATGQCTVIGKKFYPGKDSETLKETSKLLTDATANTLVIDVVSGNEYYIKIGKLMSTLEKKDNATGQKEFNDPVNFYDNYVASKIESQGQSTSSVKQPVTTQVYQQQPVQPQQKAQPQQPVQPQQQDPQYRGSGDPMKGLNLTAPSNMVIGTYYALIIGIDNYKGSWTPLKNAVSDAKAVESTLKTYYKTDVVKTLYNEQATRSNIIKELEWLVSNVKSQDNVLVYYSGHGEFKKELNKGYWVPVDATSHSTSEYVSNNDLQTYLGGIRSTHTLLISDACFSGDIFRGTTVSIPFEESDRYYRLVHSKMSRQAITSGGIEPVMDGGRDGHSVFAYYLLKELKNNQTKFFDASQLYSNIKIGIINNSTQTPQFNPIRDVGDEGGQFIFIKK